MAPKKGTKKVSLNQFLRDAPIKGDWADDGFDLPTAPAAKDFSYGGGGGLDFAPDRKDRDYASWGGTTGFARENDRDLRPDVPLPSAPPYTAFIGSMSFEATDADLADFFDGLPVTSIRIVTDGFTGRSRGFGYVEFGTLEALQDALTRTGRVLTGRPVRISVAEPPRHGFSAADDTDQWRRSGPGAGPTSFRRSGYGYSGLDDGPSGFDSMQVEGGVRAGFGSMFDPSHSTAAAGRRPPGFAGDFDPFAADEADTWRTGKPVEVRHSAQNFPRTSVGPEDEVVIDRSIFGQKVNLSSPPKTREDRPRSAGFGFATQAADDITLDRSAFGSKMPPPRETVRGRRGGSGFFDRRSSQQGETNESPWHRAGPASPRAERPHLKLQPRSSALPPIGAEAVHDPSKPSPFGAAKPVDSAERERQITERMQERLRANTAARRARKTRSNTDASSSHAGDAGSEAGDSAGRTLAPRSKAPSRPWRSASKSNTKGPAQRRPESDSSQTLSAPNDPDDSAPAPLAQSKLPLAAQLGEVTLD